MTGDLKLDIDGRIEQLLRGHDPATTDRAEFLGARFDAGLAWAHFAIGEGGLGLPQVWHTYVTEELERRGAPGPDTARNTIGLGMAAPTIAAYGTTEQKTRFLRPTYTSELIWCQLFSEPGAGSDLAAVATRAVLDGDTWIVNGQKVWTSSAHNADFAILVTRTDPGVPKHAGMTYFLCDMQEPGIEIRPLRQITGEAEFNEVFLNDVQVPDDQRLGAVGEGWQVATRTLNNERVAIGGAAARESGHIGIVAEHWRSHPEIRRPALLDRLMSFWVEAEVARLTGLRFRQQLQAGQPGPEGSAMKLTFARHAQALTGFALELDGELSLRYDDWTEVRPEIVSMTGRGPGYRFLRAKGNSIEGGTSEILRNIVAERILGLPPEQRADKGIPWKDLVR